MRRLLPAIIPAVLFFATPAFPCLNGMRKERPVSAELRDLRVAQDELSARHYKSAYDRAQRLLEGTGPTTKKWARRVQGLSALGLGRYAEAVNLLGQALREFDSEPYLLARMGEAELGAGQVDSALTRLEALDKDGLLEDAAGFTALGRAQLTRGKRDAARATVTRALKLEPTHAGALALKKELDRAVQPPPQKQTNTRGAVGT